MMQMYIYIYTIKECEILRFVYVILKIVDTNDA